MKNNFKENVKELLEVTNNGGLMITISGIVVNGSKAELLYLFSNLVGYLIKSGASTKDELLAAVECGALIRKAQGGTNE